MAATTPSWRGSRPPVGFLVDVPFLVGLALVSGDGDSVDTGGGLMAADPSKPLPISRIPARTAATTTSRRAAPSFTAGPPSRPHLPARGGAQTSKPSRRA